MLTHEDVTGVSDILPTPCRPGEDNWRSADSVDQEETARMTDLLVSAGVRSIAVCGTSGEGAALLW